MLRRRAGLLCCALTTPTIRRAVVIIRALHRPDPTTCRAFASSSRFACSPRHLWSHNASVSARARLSLPSPRGRPPATTGNLVAKARRSAWLPSSPPARCASTIMSNRATLPLPPPFSLDDVAAQARLHEDENNRAYELGRRVHAALRKLQREQDESVTASPSSSSSSSLLSQLETELDDLIRQVPQQVGGDGATPERAAAAAATSHPRKPRRANLSIRVEEYVRHLLFRHFLETDGHLMPPSSIAAKWQGRTSSPSEEENSRDSIPALLHVTDEEYLLACMGLTHDLHRHGLARATVLDRAGVERAANLVSQLFGFLMGLDFRNGPLRRRYDGTKYALKALETLLYELAVVANVGRERDDDDDGAGRLDPPEASRSAKRPRNGEPAGEGTAWPLLPSAELRELQERMVRRDELREALIKQCRDGQKAAKQAIFALQRGDFRRATQLLEECRTCIASRLVPAALEEPPLRGSGSLSGVMEEYAEARLFAAWLYGPPDEAPSPAATIASLPSRPSGALLRLQDFDVDLSLEEYVGGLCDLTGEIGRYAVLRGTARDVDGVRLCLKTVTDIYYALETIERLPQGVGKKMDPLRKGIEKMERMLYELSLSDAAGRQVSSDAPAPTTEPPARADDMGDD